MQFIAVLAVTVLGDGLYKLLEADAQDSKAGILYGKCELKISVLHNNLHSAGVAYSFCNYFKPTTVNSHRQSQICENATWIIRIRHMTALFTWYVIV